MNAIDVLLICVFGFFYAGLFYNLPVMVAGIKDLRAHSNRPKKAKPADELPFFSVILPVKNEQVVVGRLLDSLSGLNYPSERLEILIVDGCSIDQTVSICKDFASKHESVRFLQPSFSNGKPSALNYGLKHCKGEVIAVFDADSVPDPDILQKAAKYFSDSSVAAVQGRVHSINSHENMLTQFISYEDAVWSEAYLRGKDVLGLFVHLRGSCEFVRREILDELGGFDEKTLAEDMEISARLTEKRHTIKYAADVCSWQESPATLKTFLSQRSRWFRGNFEVAVKYGRLMRHLNWRSLDAEFTLFVPLVAIASMFSYALASWTIFFQFPVSEILQWIMLLSSVSMTLLLVLCASALVYVSKPKQIKNALWLPFVFSYWFLEAFLALYVLLLMMLRRPTSWVKTEKSGKVANLEFSSKKDNTAA